MIYNSDVLNRRASEFPAIKPCEYVSPTTLINSLVSFSSKITNPNSQDSAFFTSNKGNAKKITRLIQVLQVFLEGVQDEGISDLPRSAKSRLLDLHVILQRIHSLFQFCTRPDAGVWVLVNCGPVCDHFRALMGSLCDALGGFPLDLIGGGDHEVKDYVLHLIGQGKRLKFEIENEDLKVLIMIKSILGQFENRVIPDLNSVRGVMDYLGVQKWSDCNKQVKFLEDELVSDPGMGSRLLGLMAYCRCVLFQSIDEGSLENKREESYDLSCFHPDDFRCPISLEIMSDPVTISSGQTYDRGSIIKWFKAGNPVCPKTGQGLESLDMVPNLALKQLIKQYCLEYGIALPFYKDRSIVRNGCVGSLAAKEAIRMVADFLSIKLAVGTMAEKSKAAFEVKILTKRSIFNRACFVESGAIAYLLNLILSKDSTAQVNSIAALLNLSKHSQGKAVIVNCGGLVLVIGLLKHGIKIEARQNAAATLFYLSSVEEYRRLIGNNPEAIPSLVELIRVGGNRGRKNALVAIFGLLLLPSNHSKVLEARLVPTLVSLLGSMESEDLIVDSLAVLAALAEKPDGARAILRARALNTIAGILCSSSCDSSSLGREHCVSLLLALCIHGGGEVVEVLVQNTSLTGALYSLLAEGTSRASKKASSLINILHEFSERSSSRSMPQALPHENFIHVW